MLREDIKFVLKSDWEPKVPPKQVIVEQTQKNYGKIAGSVRLAQGKVSVKKEEC